MELPHVMRGCEVLAGCDVIHDHTLVGPAWALALGYDRVIGTCHGPLDGARMAAGKGVREAALVAKAAGERLVACPFGAAPEIVDDGATGFLHTEHDDLVRAVGLVDRLDRAACRAAAVARFSLERMVSQHIAMYRDTISR